MLKGKTLRPEYLAFSPLDYGLGPLPHGAIHMPDSAPPSNVGSLS